MGLSQRQALGIVWGAGSILWSAENGYEPVIAMIAHLAASLATQLFECL
jgi:hypothetical protein